MANKRSILYVVEDTKSAQFRYRVKNIIAACQNSQNYTVDFLRISELAKIEQALPDISALIFERQTSKNSTIPKLIKSAQKKGIKVIFDLDDLIFDYRDLPLLMYSTNSKNIFYWTGYFWGIRRIAKRADGFITTNRFLAKKLECSFKKPVAVISNSLNAEQISVSEKYLKSQKSHKGFILGYFSGSPTHAKDFRLIEPDLINFLKKHEDASLKIVGYMDFSARVKSLIDTGKIKFEPPVSYLKLQEKIAEVDVNLAPLIDNDFTNCKSELKFFEAAIVETPTLATPTFAFKKAIKQGQTGFLCRAGEWLPTLEKLYSDPALRTKVALAAKDYCLKTYHGQNFLKEVEGAYDALIK